MSNRGNTYGVYYATSDLNALDQWAAETHGCTWSALCRRMPDLFAGYHSQDHRVVI